MSKQEITEMDFTAETAARMAGYLVAEGWSVCSVGKPKARTFTVCAWKGADRILLQTAETLEMAEQQILNVLEDIDLVKTRALARRFAKAA